MKNNKIIVGLALIAIFIGSSLATYEGSTQIDLNSGMIRNTQKALGLTFYNSSPTPTSLSKSLGVSKQPARWLTVSKGGFSFPRTRTNPCYPKMLHRFGLIPTELKNVEISALTAKLALQELKETEDPCHLKDHLERHYFLLVELDAFLWDNSKIHSEIPRIWQNTKTEQAAPRNR